MPTQMTPQHWKRIDDLLQQTLELPTARREAFLDEHCAGDDTLRGEVLSLLNADRRDGELLDQPLPLRQLHDAPAVGRRIGAYKLTREIGRGGMGAVYLAERDDDQQFHQQVAIKLIKRGMDTDAVIERFRHERRILASLNHPNIARLLDGGTTDDGLPYFVMELIEGEPLPAYCRRKNLPIAERLKLFLQVCQAVQHAHNNLIVHRDLKPSNILVTGEGTVKLLDFGIAKLLNSDEAGVSTLSGQRPMTPEYASPEQLRGKTITTAGDVYSLGVVLYQLLTDEPPYRFDSHDAMEISRVLRERTLTPPSLARHRNPSVSRKLRGDLDNIVLTAMRTEPERRYQSPAQLAEEIERHLNGKPVNARAGTFRYRVGKFIQRNRAGVAAGVFVLLTLLTGIVLTTWQARIAKAAQLRAETALAAAEAQRLRAEREQAVAVAERFRAESALARAEEQESRAERSQQTAQRQRARAEQRFNDVRQLANAMLFEVYGEIRKLSGSTPAQALVVKYGLEYLDRLAREAGSNPTLQRELAAAFEKFGDVQGNSDAGEIGDRAAALYSYRQALKIRRLLARRSDWQTQFDLVVIHRKLGTTLTKNSQAAEAAQQFHQAMALIKSLAPPPSRERLVRMEKYSLHRRLGLLHLRQDNAEAARMHAEQARELLTPSVPPEKPVAENANVSVSEYHLSILSRLSGDLPQALTHLQRNLAKLNRDLAQNPNQLRKRSRLASTHLQIGDVLKQMDRVDEAITHYRLAVEIFSALPEQDRANARLRQNLSTGHSKLALALELNKSPEAIQHFEAALAINEALLAQKLGHVTEQSIKKQRKDLAESALEFQNLRVGAKYFPDLLAEIAAQISGVPTDIKLRVDAAKLHVKYADLTRRAGQIKVALDHYRQALATAQTATELGATTRSNIELISVCHYRIAECLMKLNDVEGAFKHLHRTAAIREALAADTAVGVAARLDPTFAYAHLIELHTSLALNTSTPRAEQIKHWEAARDWYRKSLAIFLAVRESGLLPFKHAGKPEEMEKGLAKCDAELSKLQATVGSQSP